MVRVSADTRLTRIFAMDNPRNCYCHSVDAAFRQKQGIPENFCGICDRCGEPGHTRHHPGPVPVTGAWCDRCYRIVGWTSLWRNPWMRIAIVFMVAMLVSLIGRK